MMPPLIGYDNARPRSCSTSMAPSQGGYPMQQGPFFPPYLPWPYPGPFNPPPQPSGASCHVSTPSNSTSSPAPLLPVDTPDIVAWCASLDHDERCGINGVTFASYGPVLKDDGFFHLYQLGLDSVRPSDLQEWLGVKAGLALLILDYAKQDLKAMRQLGV